MPTTPPPAPRRRCIGLLGGFGWATTAEYYARLMRLYHQRCGDDNYPETVIVSLSHGPFRRLEQAAAPAEYLECVCAGVARLLAAGADFVALAANSPHRVVEELRRRVRCPVVSALDSAAAEARALGFRRALLLGIRFTMQADFFPLRFARDGIELFAPAADEQDEIQRIIDEELYFGCVRDESRRWLIELAGRYPADGVVLGCMRLPLLLRDGDGGLRVVDTLSRHVRDILDFALCHAEPRAASLTASHPGLIME